MKTYNKKEVTEASLEYFNSDELSTNVFFKYCLQDDNGNYLEKTPDDMHRRLAKEFARIEAKYPNPMSEEKIYSYLKDFKKIVPQGSPMSGIGNNYQNVSLSNCFVIDSPADNMSKIFDTGRSLANLSKRRGGVGLDLSELRPDGSAVNNSAKTSSGAWSFADFYSNIGRMVGQNARRAAIMLTLDVLHPDIEKFIEMKHDLTKVTGANVSVRISDDFMNAVRNDADFTLCWPVNSDNPSIVKNVKAKDIWKKIVISATKTAEPGVLFWDTMVNNLPAECYSDDGFKHISTNPSLRENTLVLTDKGVFPIRYLAENDNTPTVRNIKGEWHKSKVFKSGINKQLYKITFTNGQEVYCTKEHKWPILNTTLNPYHKQSGKITKKETINLKRRDKIYFPEVDSAINNENCNYSSEDGFVLGWMLGDGWVGYHKRNKSTQYGFVFSEEDIASGIGKIVLSYTNRLAKTPSTLRQDHNSACSTYQTTDKNVHSHFSKFGVHIKQKSIGIPKSVWSGNDKFIKGFVDGIFSSDGHVRVAGTFDSYVNLTSSHIILLKDIQKLLSFYGIRSNIRTSTYMSSFPNGKTGEYTRNDLRIGGVFAKRFAKIFTLSNKNKQYRLSEILKFQDVTGRSKFWAGYKREYIDVKSVEATEIYEDVYDITVHDDTHTFAMECGITGNCSELILSAGDSCRLISQNLKTFAKNRFDKDKAFFDFKEWRECISIAMRLSDDLVDLELEKLTRLIKISDTDDEKELFQKMYNSCYNGRRTGLGTHGLADVLACLCQRYDSEEALHTINKIYENLRNVAYETSIVLAEERGAFPVFDWEKEKNNIYIKRLPKRLRDRMAKSGRRGISLLTNAPTGSVSLLSQTSSGIEPVFKNSHIRRKKRNHSEQLQETDFVDQMGDRWQEFQVFHHNAKEWIELNADKELPEFFVESNSIDWKRRVDVQAVITQYIDHSISSTINLPKGTSQDIVSDLYMKAWKSGCKGLTVYVDGSRSGVLVSEKENTFNYHDATKRPDILPCNIHQVSVKGEKWTILVGLMDGKPYEVFGGLSELIEIPKKYAAGQLIKNGRSKNTSRYNLQFGDDGMIKNVTRVFDNPTYQVHTRMVSLALRHGARPSFLIEQLLKDPDNDLTSFSKVLSRVLKKYVADGTKVTSDKMCPSCESTSLVYQEGCRMCTSCSYSACS